jgi:hypothetical protein
MGKGERVRQALMRVAAFPPFQALLLGLALRGVRCRTGCLPVFGTSA